MATLRSASSVLRLGKSLQRLSVNDNFQGFMRCIGTQGTVSDHLPVKPSFHGHVQTMVSPQQSVLNHLPYKLQTMTQDKEYICPSRLGLTQPAVAILDQSISKQGVLDCPTLPQALRDVLVPEGEVKVIYDPNSHNAPIKEAKHIIKIRRRKMNRHLLKKFRKRMLFSLRKQRKDLRKKKEKIFREELRMITKKGEDFDAMAHVQSELEIARRGGFYIEILPKESR
ncbi:uncharacterized protein LOC124257160 [Haliotis rubra]|uniref:uncharacterized protein LOC124257160 n=1 Tax=Haliotis rubra TaxID=36100 RepID=UPI001EE4F0A1|nr:uncharacterized protein LOC124257160 [Haliotis rubra]XP_046547118.1 uncharacterized protein LOC124257160 [Haliotis rubra]